MSVATVDVSSRESVHALVETATGLGEVTGLIHAAGVSPSQASPATILKVDLYGTALVLEEFGNIIARGGAGVVIASQSGHRLPRAHRRAEQGAGHDTGRGATRSALPPARPGERLAPRLPAREARELAARDGRSRSLGQARRAGQHNQPRHHHHPACQGRTHRSARGGLPAHDRCPRAGAPARRTRSGPSERC